MAERGVGEELQGCCALSLAHLGTAGNYAERLLAARGWTLPPASDSVGRDGTGNLPLIGSLGVEIWCIIEEAKHWSPSTEFRRSREAPRKASSRVDRGETTGLKSAWRSAD